MSAYVVVFVTVASRREASRLSMALLREKLVACVNALPGLKSRYWWKGKIESASELLLLIKTHRSKMPAVIRRIRALHSYSVPEIISFPIIAGNRDYLRWIDQSLKK